MEMRLARELVIQKDPELAGTPWEELQTPVLRVVVEQSVDHVLKVQSHRGLCNRFNHLVSPHGQAAKQESQVLRDWTVGWFLKKWSSNKNDKKRRVTRASTNQDGSTGGPRGNALVSSLPTLLTVGTTACG